MSIKTIGNKIINLSKNEIVNSYPENISNMFSWMENYRIRDNPIIFDVGANVGLFSLSYASLYENSEIFSFEPVPFIFDILQENIKKNTAVSNQIVPINMGLSNKKEFNELSMPTSDQHDRYKGDVNIGLYSALGNGKEKFKSEFTTLDKFFEESELPTLDFVKIDVEGYEYKVLEGGADILFKFKPLIIFELNQMTLELSGRPAEDYIKFADDLEFDIFGLQYGWKKDLLPINKPQDVSKVSDIVLVPKDKAFNSKQI